MEKSANIDINSRVFTEGFSSIHAYRHLLAPIAIGVNLAGFAPAFTLSVS